MSVWLRASAALWLLSIAASCFAADCSVAVDVGHLLEHPGASSARGATEFQFNVELARAVQRSIQHRGCRASLIGERGDVSELRTRTTLARDAALFLSVHHDSVAEKFLERWVIDGVDRMYSDRFAGFSLFVSHDNSYPERSLRCASAIGAALRSAGFSPSLFHADPAFGEVRPFADERNGVHWFDGLVVLRTASQPAVLLEAGMLINRNEELMLQRPDVREKIGSVLAGAIMDCLAGRP
jgi:N-acetylmuramoyl-L-alanine amidase